MLAIAILLCSCSSRPQMHYHSYGSWEVAIQPTCTEDGVLERECSCGAIEQTDTKALSHAYGEEEIILAPTCTDRGQINYTCKLCGEVKQTIAKKASHTPSEYYIIEDEYHAHECQVCSAITGKEDHFYYNLECIVCGHVLLHAENPSEAG